MSEAHDMATTQAGKLTSMPILFDHAQTMDTLITAFRSFALIAAHVSEEELRQAREAIASADAIGPIVDPTMYRNALSSGNLGRQRRLVDLFTRTKAELKLIFPDGWSEG